MPVVAEISKRIRVVGDQCTGWSPIGPETELPGPLRELDFKFQITGDGGNFLLLSEAVDCSCYSDTWHETMTDALEVARLKFGIDESEWHFPS